MPIKRIPDDLEEELKKIKEKIRETFGIPISYVDAGKVLAWKSKTNKVNISPENLKRILGGK